MSPIKLAAIYNLTGGQSSLDVPSWQGAGLAVAEANEQGGVLGRPVELLLWDGGTDPAMLGLMTTELLGRNPDVSALFGLSDTDMVLAAANSCAAVEHLFVTSGATSPHLPQQVPTYLYLACFGDNVQAAAAAEYAYREMGARTAAVLYRRDDTFTELLQGYFNTSFAALGGQIISARSYASLDEVAQLSEGVPPVDLLFFSAAPDDVIDGISRLRAAGLAAPIMGGDSFDLGDAWGDHPALSDVYFTTHAFVDSANPDPAMAAFMAAYRQAYPGQEASAFAALGYDTARLIVAAVAEAGSDAPATVLAALPQVSGFRGLTGTIRYDNGSRIPSKSVTVLQVHAGRMSLAGQFVPSKIPQP
ncbi:MAG: ABC transporter substrate-binding protein [Anaerolineae bacterium]|nr:ABC transporter substrate-binding protein [Anaerolineales bacterium]MCB8935400.1 ABC transporter substrate-binding protein [Promineifilum sp.]MCW5846493.1 ABC transporter substrate-binding protein [Anaerolineae bacterium]